MREEWEAQLRWQGGAGRHDAGSASGNTKGDEWRLTKVYVSTNGDAAWWDAITSALRMDGWEVRGSADMDFGRDDPVEDPDPDDVDLEGVEVGSELQGGDGDGEMESSAALGEEGEAERERIRLERERIRLERERIRLERERIRLERERLKQERERRRRRRESERVVGLAVDMEIAARAEVFIGNGVCGFLTLLSFGFVC